MKQNQCKDVTFKVYVDELPKSCIGCKYFAEHRRQCNLELCVQWVEDRFKFNDCPLIDIKTHDRELVKEVCEKIRENIEARNAYELDIINRLAILLDKIEKEFEK